MKMLFRVIDANVNRASEGLRVLEDMARFCLDDGSLSKELKIMRHSVREGAAGLLSQCMAGREASEDVGIAASMELELDKRTSFDDMAAANFKRAQEALRSVEEALKATGRYREAKSYEKIRFSLYSLEKEFYSYSCSSKKKQKLETGLYCLTASEYSRGRSNAEVVRAMLEAGVKLIQYREKDKKFSEKYAECVILREMTANAGATFIVNDHADLAMMVGADGIHLGQDDLPLEKVRELVGEEMIIGLSTHSPAQAQDAVRRGADYIGVGPIFRTFTKKDVCDPVGLEYLEYAVKNIGIPFVAIGGIKEDNMHEVLSRGARCIAMVTEIVGAEDISGKINAVKRKLSLIKEGR